MFEDFANLGNMRAGGAGAVKTIGQMDGMAQEENEDAEGYQEGEEAKVNKTAGAALSDEEEDFSLKFPKEYHSKTI